MENSEDAKILQGIETNDRLEEISKNTEASLLSQEETKDAVKDLQPSLEAIMVNTEPKEVQKVQIVAESEEDDDSLAVNFYKMLRGKKGDKGDTPTDEKIVELIKPLIPEPIPGKDADEDKIILEILNKIPKPKDGRNPITISKTMPKNPQKGDLWYKD